MSDNLNKYRIMSEKLKPKKGKDNTRESVGYRLLPVVVRAVEEQAAATNRSKSNVVETILSQVLLERPETLSLKIEPKTS